MFSDFLPILLVDRIGWLLVHSLWQFTLIAFVVAVLLRLMARSSVNARYGVCVLGWVLMVLAPTFTGILLPTPAVEIQLGDVSTPRTVPFEIPVVNTTAHVNVPVERQPLSGIDQPEPASQVSFTPESSVEAATTWWAGLETRITPWLEQLVGLWCLGVLVFAMRPCWGWYTVHRLKRFGVGEVSSEVTNALWRASQCLGLRKRVRVLQSALVRVPAMAGYFRPVILLPLQVVSGLTTAELEAVLAHELAHIRRHDYVVNLLQTLSETIFFYHPAMWWISSRIRQEREQCCDKLVVRALDNRAVYGRALLALEELRGLAPGLTLGATGGSLLERIRRLAEVEQNSGSSFGAIFAVILMATMLSRIGLWSVSSAQEASPQASSAASKSDSKGHVANTSDTPQDVPKSSHAESDPVAQAKAVHAHQIAAAVDRLPRFSIRAKAGTRTFKEMENPSPDPLQNLIRALDEPIIESDWFRYVPIFAWDEERFVLGNLHSGKVDSTPESFLGPGSFRWGTPQLSGHRGKGDNKAATHVLQEDAAAMWKYAVLSNPNYLLITHHNFWWGDNSFYNQHFGSVVLPADSYYRAVGTEEFDGESCDVIESKTRMERLWISQSSGHIRGYLSYSYHTSPGGFYRSKIVQELAGRSFASQFEYTNWCRSDYLSLPLAQKSRLGKAWSESMDFSTARPSLIVRFRDFREIVPGIWWPFHEDRAQGSPSPNGFKCMRSEYVVDEVRTDWDLTEVVRGLQPQAGEKVEDQRYTVPMKYEHRADRTEAEIREMANVEYLKRLDDQQYVKWLKEPIENMIGQPAPALPKDGWVGGSQPNLTGKPYLIHFWAEWCDPCKTDFPILKHMAEQGDPIIGLHPAGTSVEDVKKAMQESELMYPTFVASNETGISKGRTIAGYPAGLFPYCIIVDAQGKIAAHGLLFENNSDILLKFRKLLETSAKK